MQYERPKRRSGVALNLTPMIDVVFLLLVFFLLTAHFVQEKQLNIELPKAESSASLEEKKCVEVVIQADGTIHIDDKLVKLDELKETMQTHIAAAIDKEVTLRADASSRIDLTVKVMDAARLAGAQNLEIVTETP